MVTLVHNETGQSVTFDDASGFLTAIGDAEKWIAVKEASIEESAENLGSSIMQAIEHPVNTIEHAFTDMVETIKEVI